MLTHVKSEITKVGAIVASPIQRQCASGYLTDEEWDEIADLLAEKPDASHYPESVNFPSGPATSPSRTGYIDLAQEDCLAFMKCRPANIVDAIVTDPPYGISWRGSEWDSKVPGPNVWREALRVLKPGGFAVVAAAGRTYHETARSMAKAGFEIRDMLIWRYTQSFPGASPVEGAWRSGLRTNQDPWVVARKPLEKGLTLKQNWQKWGTGAVRTGAAGCSWETNVINCKKANAAEKTLGLVGYLEPRQVVGSAPSGTFSVGVSHNTHNCVKPVGLMRKICRLFTRDGGLVYDPFMGSGTTGVAAVADGYDFLGTELDFDHFETAGLRIFHAQQHSVTIPEAA